MRIFATRLPERLINRLKFRALKEHISVQELVERVLEKYLKAPRGTSEEDEHEAK